FGEKIVIRLIDRSRFLKEKEELGMSNEDIEIFNDVLKNKHGIILITGPTGSGKSTTLYAGLNYLKDPTKNITTVEDPVEYQLRGINQIQVKPDIGLDFAASLRAILRQDPDIILLGEIRDKETVDIAVKASLTGHLVLSTFHTNDTPSAISRLSYMGVERYLLASTLNLVLAQRLVRRICKHCKEPITLPEATLSRLGLTKADVANAQVSHGKGCSACGGTGYSGRLPIFEFMPIDEDMRTLIVNEATESEMRAMAKKKGWGVLLDSGIRAVLDGLTTAEEAISVAYTAHSQESVTTD
ncbi:MAG: GspE/PulE family protein, partial [Desulfobacterales bacterium]|nr:GspE/PulE family protein [Desulfobacterales bacterium]